MPKGILSWKQTQFTIFVFALANDEPRGAWKILAEFDFNLNPATFLARSADAFFRGEPNFVLLRRR